MRRDKLLNLKANNVTEFCFQIMLWSRVRSALGWLQVGGIKAPEKMTSNGRMVQKTRWSLNCTLSFY